MDTMFDYVITSTTSFFWVQFSGFRDGWMRDYSLGDGMWRRGDLIMCEEDLLAQGQTQLGDWFDKAWKYTQENMMAKFNFSDLANQPYVSTIKRVFGEIIAKCELITDRGQIVLYQAPPPGIGDRIFAKLEDLFYVVVRPFCE